MFCLLIILRLLTSTDAVTLTGSSEYAVPGHNFAMICGVPEEAGFVQLYRRGVSSSVGVIDVDGGQCRDYTSPSVPCSPGVCSCTVSRTYSYYGTEFRWVIQPRTRDHGSLWFCLRYNDRLPDSDVFSSSPDYTLKVTDGLATIVLSPPDTTYTRTEGDTLPDITCTADCKPNCSFVWTKPDNTNLTASAVLSLGQLDRAEHGTFRCTARNAVGELTTTTNVTVLYGPGDFMGFTPGPDVVDRTENQTVPDITCFAVCIPPCIYTWSRAGTIFPNPLSLSLALRTNSGQYTCTASNSVSNETKAWNLNVRFPPRILNISYTQGDADVPEGGSMSLLCTVDSSPPSTIQWFYKANNSELLTITDVLESTYTLTTAGCLDTGLYTCSAKNIASNIAVTMDIPINVLCKPRPFQILDHDLAFDLATLETLTIPAKFISNPQPSFTWTFQLSQFTPATTLVNGMDKFSIRNNFEMTNLFALSEGTRTDMEDDWFGLYNVTATNSQGSAMLSFTVREQHDPSNVSLSPPTTSYTPTEGQTIPTITCSADCNPACTYNWTKDGQSRSTGSDLQLTNIQREQTGVYRCMASNVDGSQTSSDVGVTVNSKPSDGNTAIIGGTAGAVAAVVGLIIGVVVVIFRRRRHQPSAQQPAEDEHQYEEIGLEQVGIPVEEDVVTDQREQELYDDFSLEQIGIPAVDGVVTDNGGGATGDNRHQYDEIGMEQVGIQVEEDVVTDNAGGMPGENRQQYEALIPEQVEFPAAYDVLADNGGGMSGESSNAYLLMKKQPEDEYVDVSSKPENDGGMSGESSNAYLLMKKQPEDEYVDVSPKPDNDSGMSGASSNAYLLMKKQPEDEYVDVSPRPGTGQDSGYINTSLH